MSKDITAWPLVNIMKISGIRDLFKLGRVVERMHLSMGRALLNFRQVLSK